MLNESRECQLTYPSPSLVLLISATLTCKTESSQFNIYLIKHFMKYYKILILSTKGLRTVSCKSSLKNVWAFTWTSP